MMTKKVDTSPLDGKVKRTVMKKDGRKVIVLPSVAPKKNAPKRFTRGYWTSPAPSGYVDVLIPYVDPRGVQRMERQRVKESNLKIETFN